MASKTTLQAVDDPSLTFDPIKVGGDVVLAQHAEVIRALGKRVVHDVIGRPCPPLGCRQPRTRPAAARRGRSG
jgi:hypothetical protein